jgi:hypothetical protein
VKQDFLKPKLNGERFGDHTVPLELLKDFAALQEMLVEVAKWEFRNTHPNRERIPRNFTAGIDLHLTSVEEGSAVLTISLVFASLFPSSESLPYFEQARTHIVESIALAEQGMSPTLPPYLLNYFDRFGRGLRPGESISFESQNGPAALTPDTRAQLMHYAQAKEWTEETALRVRIPEAGKGRSSFEMELRDGTKLRAELTDLNQEVILNAFANYNQGHDEYVLVQGGVKKDRSNHLKSFEYIEHVTPLDPRDVDLRLDELSELKDGWLNGEGIAPSIPHLENLKRAFELYFDSELPLPYLYPTPEGGIQAEWSLGDWEISLGMSRDSVFGEYYALNIKDDSISDKSQKIEQLDGREGWLILNGLLRSASPSKVEG